MSMIHNRFSGGREKYGWRTRVEVDSDASEPIPLITNEEKRETRSFMTIPKDQLLKQRGLEEANFEEDHAKHP